jgi:hypothetical protein
MLTYFFRKVWTPRRSSKIRVRVSLGTRILLLRRGVPFETFTISLINSSFKDIPLALLHLADEFLSKKIESLQSLTESALEGFWTETIANRLICDLEA